MLLSQVWLTTKGGEARGTTWTTAIPVVGEPVEVQLDSGGRRRAVVENVQPGSGPYAAVLSCRLAN
jgi:hypothetical protein